MSQQMYGKQISNEENRNGRVISLSFGRYILICNLIISLLFILMCYSPAERRSLFGNHFLFELIFMFSYFVLLSAFSVSSILNLPILSISNIVVIVAFVISLLMQPALITVASEHAWTRLNHMIDGDVCGRIDCENFKILERKSWDDECSDYLVYFHDCGGLSPEACFRKKARINNSNNIYQVELDSNYYSDIVCEQ